MKTLKELVESGRLTKPSERLLITLDHKGLKKIKNRKPRQYSPIMFKEIIMRIKEVAFEHYYPYMFAWMLKYFLHHCAASVFFNENFAVAAEEYIQLLLGSKKDAEEEILQKMFRAIVNARVELCLQHANQLSGGFGQSSENSDSTYTCESKQSLIQEEEFNAKMAILSLLVNWIKSYRHNGVLTDEFLAKIMVVHAFGLCQDKPTRRSDSVRKCYRVNICSFVIQHIYERVIQEESSNTLATVSS